MKQNKVFQIIILLFVGTFLFSCASTNNAFREGAKEVSIVFTNDLHAWLEPFKEWAAKSEGKVGGFAYMKGYVEEVKQEKENVVFLDAGDYIMGPNISSLTQGEAIIEVMNTMEYDAVVLGNHEFDHHYKQTIRLMEIATFPVLGSNIYYNDGQRFAPESVILDKDGLRIGVVGILAKDVAKDSIQASLIDGLTFRDEREELRSLVGELRKSVDLVVVLAHEGLSGYQSSTADTDSFRKKDLDVHLALANSIPGIDILLTGHSHQGIEVFADKTGTLIMQNWGLGRSIGRIDVTVHKENGTIVSVEKRGRLIPVDLGTIEAHPPTVAEIEKQKTAVSTIISRPVGASSIDLTRTDQEDSSLGTLITSAMLHYYEGDIAVTNSRGIRSDIAAGDITIGDVITALPFDDLIRVVTLTGEDIIGLIEHALTFKNGNLQIAGMEVRYDLSKEEGNRAVGVTIDGRPLELKRSYRVVTQDFLSTGGGGYLNFHNARERTEYVELLYEVVAKYITELGVITEKWQREDRWIPN